MDTAENEDDSISAASMQATYDPDAIQADAINGVMSASAPRYMDTEDARIVQAASIAPQTKPQLGKNRFFGIPKAKAAGFPNNDDYENKYAEDAYGEEMGPTARVWRTYIDEAQKADTELVEGWRDTTDVILVFAGLFSAVVATFVVQTSTNLQANYTQIAASLLFEQNLLLRATANHTSLDDITPSPLTPDSTFPVSANDRWINGLWFTSLSVSLVTAFMAVLVKQWIQHYVSVVSGTPLDQVRIRQFRFLGVEKWHMPPIISMLPMLLHLALLLFFAGLVLFMLPLDPPIAYTTAVIAVVAYAFYFISNALPLWHPMCPYKTPLSSLIAASPSTLRSLYYALRQYVRHGVRGKPFEDQSSSSSERDNSPHVEHRALHHMKEAEKASALHPDNVDHLDAKALVWLYSSSSNPTVASVAVQAISGLRFGFLKPARDILKKVVTFRWDSVEDALLRNMDYDDQHGRLADDRLKVERFLRACHQLEATLRSPWSQTRDVIFNTSDPALQILRDCHSMLDEYPNDSQQEAEAPLTCLESYDYEREKPTGRVMWGWGEYSVLAGSPARIEKVLPQIYSALSEAMRVFCTLSTSEMEPVNKDFQLQSALPLLFAQNFKFIRWGLEENVDPVDQEAITMAASTLRLETQKLAESDSFWKNQESSDQRAKLCDLLVDPGSWLRWPSTSRDYCWNISWTPGLMDCFLRSYNRGSWAESSFSKGNPDVYRLFEEKDGLSKVTREMHKSRFFNDYLAGLIRWKDDSDDWERHINYLFAPTNFARIVEQFILQKQEDGTYGNFQVPLSVGKLFRLRSPDQYPDVYGEFRAPLLELVKDRPNIWPPKPESASAESGASDSENKTRWTRFFSTGKATLLRWIPRRAKTGSQTDPELRGAEAA